MGIRNKRIPKQTKTPVRTKQEGTNFFLRRMAVSRPEGTAHWHKLRAGLWSMQPVSNFKSQVVDLTGQTYELPSFIRFPMVPPHPHTSTWCWWCLLCVRRGPVGDIHVRRNGGSERSRSGSESQEERWNLDPSIPPISIFLTESVMWQSHDRVSDTGKCQLPVLRPSVDFSPEHSTVETYVYFHS